MFSSGHPSVRLRPAEGADGAVLARFIARMNEQAATRCLHAGGGSARVADVRAGLREFLREEGKTVGGFVLAEREADGELLGAAGCRREPGGGGGDDASGFLWGPFVDGPAHQAVARPMLGALRRQIGGVRRLGAFLDENNARGLSFLAAEGFRRGPRTHVFTTSRRVIAPEADGGPPGGELRTTHAAGFARLHEATFPTDETDGSTAEALLAGRDAEHRIFTVTDGGLRLLGYCCARVLPAPREGFIDFLAVKELARGRGLGGRLLRAACRWFFDELGLPAVSLCVSEWRAGRNGARRLYEREGFALRFTGVAARREW